MLEQTDIPSVSENADISVDETETQLDTSQAPSLNDDPTQTQDAEDSIEQTPPSPFATGKEKFKVNGQDKEWDWATTKKYAQLGYAGQAALERAHETEQKHKSFYSKLTEHAEHDPEGLIRILNPRFQGFASKAATPQGAGTGPNQGEELDPRDAKIQELESRTSSFEEMIEKQEIDKERQAIASELEDAVKEYPELNNEINREYVKSQYARMVRKGIEGVTLADVAFHVSQKVKEMREADIKAKTAKALENKKKAPVGGSPAGTPSSAKPQSREDLKRMAGLM